MKSRASSSGSGKDGANADDVSRDEYTYIYVLLRELVTVMADLQVKPPKKYDYHDWAWYLHLLGQNEADADQHRSPPGGDDLQEDDEVKDHTEIGKADGPGNAHKDAWSWFGLRSPLMSTKTESEWISDRLSKKLESEMERLRRGGKGARPPVTMDDLVNRMKEGGQYEHAKREEEKKKTS
jgi:potassium channel subfamily K